MEKKNILLSILLMVLSGSAVWTMDAGAQFHEELNDAVATRKELLNQKNLTQKQINEVNENHARIVREIHDRYLQRLGQEGYRHLLRGTPVDNPSVGYPVFGVEINRLDEDLGLSPDDLQSQADTLSRQAEEARKEAERKAAEAQRRADELNRAQMKSTIRNLVDGVSRTMVNDVLNGRRDIPSDLTERVTERLGQSPDLVTYLRSQDGQKALNDSLANLDEVQRKALINAANKAAGRWVQNNPGKAAEFVRKHKMLVGALTGVIAFVLVRVIIGVVNVDKGRKF